MAHLTRLRNSATPLNVMTAVIIISVIGIVAIQLVTTPPTELAGESVILCNVIWGCGGPTMLETGTTIALIGIAMLVGLYLSVSNE